MDLCRTNGGRFGIEAWKKFAKYVEKVGSTTSHKVIQIKSMNSDVSGPMYSESTGWVHHFVNCTADYSHKCDVFFNGKSKLSENQSAKVNEDAKKDEEWRSFNQITEKRKFQWYKMDILGLSEKRLWDFRKYSSYCNGFGKLSVSRREFDVGMLQSSVGMLLRIHFRYSRKGCILWPITSTSRGFS